MCVVIESKGLYQEKEGRKRGERGEKEGRKRRKRVERDLQVGG